MEKPRFIFERGDEENTEELRREREQKAKEEIDQMSVPFEEIAKSVSEQPPEYVRPAEDAIYEKMKKRAGDYGTGFVFPRVYYVPHARKGEFDKKTYSPERNDHAAFYKSGTDIIVMFLQEGKLNYYTAMGQLAHEMSHASNYQALRIRKSPPPSFSGEERIDTYRSGGHIISSRGLKYGGILEEGMAVLDERKTIDEIADRFPVFGEMKRKSEVIKDHMVSVGVVQEDRKDDYYVSYGIKDDKVDIIFDKLDRSYSMAAKLMKYISGKIEGGVDLINRARIRGNLVEFAKAFDSSFGRGAFRVFMSTDLDADEIAKLKGFLDETDPAKKDALAVEILAKRRHDLSRYERQTGRLVLGHLDAVALGLESKEEKEKSRTCSRCGQEMSSSLKFCGNCGSELG